MGRYAFPGRVDLTGCDIRNVGLKAHRHIAGVRCGLAQMHGDLFGDNDPAQYTAGQNLLRCRAAAAVPGKQRMGRYCNDPRKLLAPGAEAIKATVREKIELFGSANKA